MNPPSHPRKERFRRLWRKQGASLSGSLGFHLLVLVIASIWVLRVVPAPAIFEKRIDFMPPGGGGGDPALLELDSRRQHLDFANRRMERISAQGALSELSLPEPFKASPLKSPFPADPGRTGGLGGKGTGGGKGDGRGRGFGDGTGLGAGPGRGAMNPFGLVDPGESRLEGTFYNLNRNPDGSPRATRYADYSGLVTRFVAGNWNHSLLSGCMQAGTTLYLPHLYLPVTSARMAPASFGQQPEVHPYWMLLYRGTVIAPKTGKFRFVGAGDDVLAVRFAKRNVFDHGYLHATGAANPGAPIEFAAPTPDPAAGNVEIVPKLAFYRYPSTVDWNRNLGGLAAGPYFEVTEGEEYPIEILIAEGQGSLFAAALLIEEFGATYRRIAGGPPVLPLFRTEPTHPPHARRDNAPPYYTDSPVWKVVKGRNKI